MVEILQILNRLALLARKNMLELELADFLDIEEPSIEDTLEIHRIISRLENVNNEIITNLPALSINSIHANPFDGNIGSNVHESNDGVGSNNGVESNVNESNNGVESNVNESNDGVESNGVESSDVNDLNAYFLYTIDTMLNEINAGVNNLNEYEGAYVLNEYEGANSLDEDDSTDSLDVANALDEDYEEFIADVPIPLVDYYLKQLKISSFLDIVDENPECDKKCSICLIEFEENDGLMILQCQHIYHQNCVEIWFTTKPTCPICRSDQRDLFDSVTSEDEGEDKKADIDIVVRETNVSRFEARRSLIEHNWDIVDSIIDLTM